MQRIPVVALNNGVRMPMMGLGTWQITSSSEENTVYKTLEFCLKAGYRMIDTAPVYKNEKDIGNALKELLPKYGLKRSDIFITSKLAPADHGTEKARDACLQSIKRLECDYLDLYLIHWPAASELKNVDDRNKPLRKESWLALEALNKEDVVRSIGISNYTMDHLKELFTYASVTPAILQIEFHPYLYQRDLLDFCKSRDIQLQAYSSLGIGQLISDPQIDALASKHGKTTAQILLKWAVEHNLVVIPKSTNEDHIMSNAQIFDFELLEEDMNFLNSLHCNKHFFWDPATVS